MPIKAWCTLCLWRIGRLCFNRFLEPDHCSTLEKAPKLCLTCFKSSLQPNITKQSLQELGSLCMPGPRMSICLCHTVSATQLAFWSCPAQVQQKRAERAARAAAERAADEREERKAREGHAQLVAQAMGLSSSAKAGPVGDSARGPLAAESSQERVLGPGGPAQLYSMQAQACTCAYLLSCRSIGCQIFYHIHQGSYAAMLCNRNQKATWGDSWCSWQCM